MLFVVGMKVVVHDELDYRTGLVVGVSFWAGAGFQNGAVFPEYFAEFAGGLLQNGMTAGGLVAILMTLFVELTAPRPSRSRWSSEWMRCRRSGNSSRALLHAAAGTRPWPIASTPPARKRC